MKSQRDKNKNLQKFKQLCQSVLRRDPPMHLASMIKQSNLVIDIQSFGSQDITFAEVWPKISFNKIIITVNQNKNKKADSLGKKFYDTPRFRELLQLIAANIEESSSIKSLVIEKFRLGKTFIKQLNNCLEKSKYIKQLCLRQCQLTDDHFQIIKNSLMVNESLIALDVSKNQLELSGGMIGKVLSQHSQRRNQVIWMYSLRGQVPEYDVSSSGLCEVNLSNNKINDESVQQMISFLKNDNWTRCINLKNNNINKKGVRGFAALLKSNTSIISLDLRQNPGFSREYSKYIYRKLVGNMQKYKKEKGKVVGQANNSNANLTIQSAKKSDNYKSLEQSRRKSVSSNKGIDFSLRNNLTINLGISSKNKNGVTVHCQKCKESTFNLLRLEKRNLDLQLQLRKVRHILLTKNIDISAIFPHHNQQHNSIQQSFSFNRQTGTNQQEDLLLRMQQVMNQLTRIMQAIEAQQNTQTHIQNPLSNPNSFSNTIPLFTRADQLQLSND